MMMIADKIRCRAMEESMHPNFSLDSYSCLGLLTMLRSFRAQGSSESDSGMYLQGRRWNVERSGVRVSAGRRRGGGPAGRVV